MDSLFANTSIISFYFLVDIMCICVYYCKYYNELCYGFDFHHGFDFEQVIHCKYYNELSYKAP